jgi:hypothetical protein
MLIRNDKDRIEIAQLKDYNGTDEYMKVLAGYYQDIHKRFFSNGLPVIFTHPKIKKGSKILQNVPALAQEDIPWKSYIKTNKNGSESLRYCLTNIPKPLGGFDFLPTHCKVTEQRWAYTEIDIDQILALMNTLHYKTGIISIIDDEAFNKAKAETHGKSSFVGAHIFSEIGDLYSDEKRLNEFCQAWGISIKGKFLEQKKNELFDAVEKAEKEHKGDYGYEAFKRAITDTDPYFSIRASVQEALEKNLIRFDTKKYVVTFQNGEVLMRVPIDKSPQWKQLLFEYLGKHPESLSFVETTNETAPTHELRKLEIIEPVTEEYLRSRDGRLSFFDKKILVREIKGWTNTEVKSYKQDELEEMLVDYYIKQGKSRP